ncbi:MAG TPA: Clp1/GlmU family protein, partial [Candidatus Dormibacteraeota bacterium]|nr:Clp1/GlmU family protein [Candidatus Dormibacteraeota bacterium]
IRLSVGMADCLAAPLRLDEWVMVRELRQYPLQIIERCEIQIELEQQSSWMVVDESTVPVGWLEAAHVAKRQLGAIAIVGEANSGKSSLCAFLTNMCVRDGLRVGVVDGDVGQADIGPPTTVSSAKATSPVMSLQELRSEHSFFVGDTSPSSVPEKLIRQLISLKQDLATSTDLLILNTDGWIGDSTAVRFKEELLDRIRPDLVLGLGGNEIEPLLRMLSSPTLKLSSSHYARARSKDERKNAREAGYRRFLADSKVLSISQENTRLRMFDQPQQSILQWDRRYNGFLTGLLDSDERLLTIGRVRDMHDGTALVETRATEQPRFLEVGNVMVSSSYEETGSWKLH